MQPSAAQNQITLRGNLSTLPQFSHENHGRRFFRFLLEVPRLSGAVDVLPVIAPESVLQTADPTEGSMVAVSGQIRSHNIRQTGRRHLSIFVFAATVAAEDGAPENTVQLTGALCREPVYRRTPLGREICDMMLAVPRPFHRSDYLPCILWGRVAAQAADCAPGQTVALEGRLQSRVYTKLTADGAQERTAYEISAMTAWFPEIEP